MMLIMWKFRGFANERRYNLLQNRHHPFDKLRALPELVERVSKGEIL